MKILVVGSGGREHAIVRALRKSGRAEEIFVLPGNGGMKDDATLVPIGAKDIPAITEFAAANKVDYAVVAPDDPLVLGAVDALGGNPMADAFGLVAMVAMTPLIAIQSLALVYAFKTRKLEKAAAVRPETEIIDFD